MSLNSLSSLLTSIILEKFFYMSEIAPAVKNPTKEPTFKAVDACGL